MSEISFEEFDLERGYLTNGDQHSNSESLATTMTSSTDQANTLQLKDLEFELGWKTRDEIMCSLSQHTTLLSGLIIKADARKKVHKTNVDLVATLMNLPLKVGGRSRSFESLGRSADDSLNEVLLDLSSDVRSKIVDTLMINHNVALLEADSVSSECKSKLIDRNNELICELVKLRSRTVSKGTAQTENLGRKFLRLTNLICQLIITNQRTNRFNFSRRSSNRPGGRFQEI